MMNQGLVDIGLFMEPVNTEGLDYIRIMDSDHWVVGMKPDDPLACNEYITKDDLLDKPLILPKRRNVQSELANWFGKDLLVQRRLYPEIAASTVIAWRRNIPYSLAINKFIEEINAFQA